MHITGIGMPGVGAPGSKHLARSHGQTRAVHIYMLLEAEWLYTNLLQYIVHAKTGITSDPRSIKHKINLSLVFQVRPIRDVYGQVRTFAMCSSSAQATSGLRLMYVVCAYGIVVEYARS